MQLQVEVEVSNIRCLEATSIIHNGIMWINNKNIVQMYGWGVEVICAINIPVGVSISDMYSHEDTHDSQT